MRVSRGARFADGGLKILGPIIVVALAVLLGMSAAALADTRVVVREGTSLGRGGEDLPEGLRQSLEGQEPTTVTYWIGNDRAARVDESGSMIARLDRGESYFVDRRAESYTVIEISDRESREGLGGSWKTVETGETRSIGTWTAKRHEMTIEVGGEPIEVTLWVADIGVDLDAYHAFIESVAQAQGADWMRAYLELDGYPVRQEVRVGGILSWQEVESVSEESPPSGTYEVPEGYSQKE